MKHLKVFQTHEDYLDFTATPEYVLPNVSYCINNSEDALVPESHPDVHYNPQLRVTYYVNSRSINTKFSVLPPAPNPIVNIINPNLTLSDYIKDVTFMGNVIPVEGLFNDGLPLPVGKECTLLLTLKDVAEIPVNMFKDCGHITKVVIPDSVDTINRGAFNYCTGLKTIDLGKVINIDNYVFCGCENLSQTSREQIANINLLALECEQFVS